MLTGQMNRKRRTFSKFRFDRDVAVVALDDLLCDRKANAQAARLARAARIGPPEAAEDARKVLFRDADAGIGHDDLHVAARGSH